MNKLISTTTTAALIGIGGWVVGRVTAPIGEIVMGEDGQLENCTLKNCNVVIRNDGDWSKIKNCDIQMPDLTTRPGIEIHDAKHVRLVNNYIEGARFNTYKSKVLRLVNHKLSHRVSAVKIFTSGESNER